MTTTAITKMRTFRSAAAVARRVDDGACAMDRVPGLAVGIADTKVPVVRHGAPTNGLGIPTTTTRLLGTTT